MLNLLCKILSFNVYFNRGGLADLGALGSGQCGPPLSSQPAVIYKYCIPEKPSSNHFHKPPFSMHKAGIQIFRVYKVLTFNISILCLYGASCYMSTDIKHIRFILFTIKPKKLPACKKWTFLLTLQAKKWNWFGTCVTFSFYYTKQNEMIVHARWMDVFSRCNTVPHCKRESRIPRLNLPLDASYV